MSSPKKSCDSRKRKAVELQPAIVRLQISQKRSNDLHTHRIMKDLVKVGRGVDCDIKILSTFVSRQQCAIQKKNGSGSWSLTNLTENSSTYVNGKKLEQFENILINFGSLIQFSHEDEWTYEFCQIDKAFADTLGPVQIYLPSNDVSNKINGQRGILYLHQQEKNGLELESMNLQSDYQVLVQKARDLAAKKKTLSQQVEEATQAAALLDKYTEDTFTALQNVQSDYENLCNSMKLQYKIYESEEQSLPDLTQEVEWEKLKVECKGELDSAESMLKNMILTSKGLSRLDVEGDQY